MATTEVLLALLTVLGAIYGWVKYTFSYWKRKNVPYLETTPFLGSTKVIFQGKTSFPMHLSKLHTDPKVKNEAAVGIYVFNKPGLLIRNLDMIKSILIKNFHKFSNRSAGSDPHDDAMAHYNLFFSKNPIWKPLRTKLTPVFTSGKVKQMYPLMVEVGNDLEKHLSTYKKENDSFVIDGKEVCARYTTDQIATISFGIKANCLSNVNAAFRVHGRKILELSLERAYSFFICFFFPSLASLARAKIFPKAATDYFRRTFTDIMTERERSGTKRNDLIDVLLNIKKETELNPEKEKVFLCHEDVLVAQAVLFYAAGFETSSSTMSFAFYELAKNPDMQNRLREEIHEALMEENGTLSYEKLQSLEYLSMVVNETLRQYPTVPYLDREYDDIPGEPRYNLKPHYDFEVPNKMPIFISTYALQHDPQYWPNPSVFDPERFSKENKKNITDFTYMPFGEGNRNCLGMRIGLLQTKVGLIHFFKNHRVELHDPNQKLEFDPRSFTLTFNNVLKLKIINDNMFEKAFKK